MGDASNHEAIQRHCVHVSILSTTSLTATSLLDMCRGLKAKRDSEIVPPTEDGELPNGNETEAICGTFHSFTSAMCDIHEIQAHTGQETRSVMKT